MPKISKKFSRDNGASRVSRVSRDSRAFLGTREPIGEVTRFLKTYVVLPKGSETIIAAWVIAAWFADVWDKFGHLCIVSPEKRCGKTTLLDLLFLIAPKARFTTKT